MTATTGQALSVLGFLALAMLGARAAAQSASSQAAASADPRREVVRAYASSCHALYGECEAHARALEKAIAALEAAPDARTLDAARRAWIAGRRIYGMTEVFRFYGGPIDDPHDGVETFVNAWPLDEGYIDSVEGNPESGIINDPKRYPKIGEAVLVLANERGGEANVSLGWHAIEFLLWGQDRDPAGPGNRQASDFDPARAKSAARRIEYIETATSILVRHLARLRAAWAPDVENYRRRFEADPDGALRKILTGAVVLSGFELGGERLAVAYETRDQEQEHSCFSDTTHLDFEANQAGIEAVFRGGREPGSGPGVLALVKRDHPALAADLDRKLTATRAKLAAIPRPFDQAFLGADDGPGRSAIRAALLALDQQTDAIAIVGRAFSFELPLKPGG